MARREWSGLSVVRLSRLALLAVVVVSNAAGAGVVFALIALVLPGSHVDDEGTVRIVNAAMAGGYLLLAITLGLAVGSARARPVIRWLREEREPTEAEQRRALRTPLTVFTLHAVMWTLAALVFGGVNAFFSIGLAVRVLVVVLLGGVTTSAITYLLSERVMRPVAIRALASGLPGRNLGPGVSMRFLLSWALGTAVPVVGIVTTGIVGLAQSDASRDALALTMVALGAIALVVGLLAMLVTVRAVSVPVRSVRRALAAVQKGDLDVALRVEDGSELGRLQAGVNAMAEGLRERERLSDLFGRHVGADVARAALERGVELGGETKDVAVLFVDVVGSTKLAGERPPQEVVAVLNRFFAIVVEVVDAHGGSVNKFEGDAALAVFGAPVELERRDLNALAAARTLGERLRDEVSELRAGVGVSSGEVVAGNVGATARFEYTVIGDAVNEAARLSDAAKEDARAVLAAARLLDDADAEERERWEDAGERTLRGRSEPTRLVAPRA